MSSEIIGCSILFVNDKQEVLLLLRDDIPTIQCPNMWDLPGGHVEAGETPEQCIVREMKEEIGLDLIDYALFEKRKFADRLEFTFWKRLNLDPEKATLYEGQRLQWFNESEAANTKLAFGFNLTVANFFRDKSLSGT